MHGKCLRAVGGGGEERLASGGLFLCGLRAPLKAAPVYFDTWQLDLPLF